MIPAWLAARPGNVARGARQVGRIRPRYVAMVNSPLISDSGR